MPHDMNLDPAIASEDLQTVIERAEQALRGHQQPEGHWVFELEADATIPAEYVLLEHYLDRIDDALQAKIGVYLRRIQGEHGGWPLYHGGAFNISASVKAYFALKAIGDDPAAPHMARARKAILAAGGAERSNVFTRVQLALFGQVPWRAVSGDAGGDHGAAEMVPLPPAQDQLLVAHGDGAAARAHGDEAPGAQSARRYHRGAVSRPRRNSSRDWIRGPYRSGWGRFFKTVDVVMQKAEPRFSKDRRQRHIEDAVRWVGERLNGEDGLGAIYPAMANSVMMYDVLGYPADHPQAAIAWRSVRNLVTVKGEEAYCQPCFSPIWDTGLAGHAMAEAQGPGAVSGASGLEAAAEWLVARQITEVRGDWAEIKPDVPPGGWAFQFNNDYYPDVDDTAVVAMLLHRNGNPAHAESIEKARRWIIGMQSRNGGWGAFDADNNHDFLNHIPFADHGALLDPPTADVTARCVSFLAQLGHAEDAPVIARAITYLRGDQKGEGCWFGRWGTNYIYGTWSVLCALNAAGLGRDDPMVRRAVEWLLAKQRSEGGWGEDCASYEGAPPGEFTESLPSQTAWAVLGLMAAGEADHEAVVRGIAWLAAQQRADGEWEELPYNAVGFPRVFYLRYHGYRLFFPLMALARFRNLRQGNSREVAWGF